MVDIALGQQVVILEGGGRSVTERRGKVVKIGRVWIDVQPDSGGSVQRFRMTTQKTASDIGYGTYFYTLDQWAEHKRQEAASEFLRSQGIRVDNYSPWRRREVELADLIRAATKTTD